MIHSIPNDPTQYWLHPEAASDNLTLQQPCTLWENLVAFLMLTKTSLIGHVMKIYLHKTRQNKHTDMKKHASYKQFTLGKFYCACSENSICLHQPLMIQR